MWLLIKTDPGGRSKVTVCSPNCYALARVLGYRFSQGKNKQGNCKNA